MARDHHKSARIGIYECLLDGSLVIKGKRVKDHYGLFYEDILYSKVIPDLQYAKSAGRDFEFPVLVVSYYLGGGDPPKPLPKPSGTLTVKSAGGLNQLRRMMGVPVRRKKIPATETWQVVVDDRGQVFKVQGNRITGTLQTTPK